MALTVTGAGTMTVSGRFRRAKAARSKGSPDLLPAPPGDEDGGAACGPTLHPMGDLIHHEVAATKGSPR